MQNLWQNIWDKYMEQKNKRPVILVVDTDEGYVNALEIKLIKKYIDKADLEFITDRRYLQEYLETDPIVAVLVVGETVYTQELQQLLPVYTFVLTDETGKEKLGDQIYGIFRYSSGQNILHTIESIVPDSFFEEQICDELDDFTDDSDFNLDQESNVEVILVTSAAGGVGKTTVALALTMIAAENGRKSMYLNLDYISDYDRWLMKSKDGLGTQILAVNREISDQSKEEDKLNVLYKMIRSQKYDTIIIDININNRMLLNQILERSNLILLITGNNNSEIYSSNKLYRQLNSKWINKSIFVCGNDNVRTCDERGKSAEYKIEKYISHMEDYETLIADDLKENRDFCQLYQIINDRLSNLMKVGIEIQ